TLYISSNLFFSGAYTAPCGPSTDLIIVTGTDNIGSNVTSSCFSTCTNICQPDLPAPKLEIARQGANVQLTWPPTYSNYALIDSDNVVGGLWKTNTSTRTITPSNISVLSPITNSQMFYRLKAVQY